MRKTVNFFSKVVGVLTIFALTSCHTPAKKEQRPSKLPRKEMQKIKINIVTEPHNIDPHKARSLNDINITKMFMEGLTKMDKHEEPQLAQAQNVQISDDQLTYTFSLKKTKWSNGDPVTAQDFAYAWKRVLSPDFQADNAHQLFVIKNAKDIKKGDLPVSLLGVSCPDEATLVIELEHPVPYFLKLVSLPVFFPVNQRVDKKHPNWAFSVDTFVGNGPFAMSTWNHHDKIVATKNPHYWNANQVNLEEIEMLMVSEDTGLQMFENNQLDWDGAPFSSVSQKTFEKSSYRKQLKTLPKEATFWVSMNMEHPLFKEVGMRKALNYALNKKEIATLHAHLKQTPIESVIPLATSSQTKSFKNNVTLAQTLFQESLEKINRSQEDFSTIQIAYIASKQNEALAEFIQQQWFEHLGILLKLNPLDTETFYEKLHKKELDLVCHNLETQIVDPAQFLETFTDSLALANWSEPAFTESLTSSFICRDLSQKEAILAQAEKMILDALPIIPLCNSALVYMQNQKLKNVHISQLGDVDFSEAYVDSL